jgi:predicted RNase H-like nuclease (RuvC/YqgF family)
MPSVPSAEAQPTEPCVTTEEVMPALPPGRSPDSLPQPPHPQRRCAPASANASAQPSPRESASAQPSTEAGNAPAAPDQKSASELAKLSDELKEAQKELDLLQRELSLEQDSYFSNPDYVHNTAGKSKIDALQQHVGDKQQEVEHLKTRLAALKEAQGNSKSAPPQP